MRAPPNRPRPAPPRRTTPVKGEGPPPRMVGSAVPETVTENEIPPSLPQNFGMTAPLRALHGKMQIKCFTLHLNMNFLSEITIIVVCLGDVVTLQLR